MLYINKKHLIFISLVLFVFTHKVSADVFINEVQVLPTDGRFIELYNSGGDINLTDWSIKRKTVSGTEYVLVSASRLKDKIISSGSYFILANESSYAGGVTPDATWAKSYDIASDNMIYLYDNNGNITSKIGWGKVSDCDGTCPSNPTTDKSIQRTSSSSWIVDSPTPGEVNSSTGSSSVDSQSDSGGTDSSPSTSSQRSSSGSSSKVDEQKVYKIATKIIAPKIVTAGIPFIIDHQTTGVRNEKVILGKFVWNFGDGNYREVSMSDPFEYAYQYGGDYVLTLSFYDSILKDKPDVVDRINIKVTAPGLIVSSVGQIDDPFIEIENNSSYEMNLFNFIIKGSIHSFVIPAGTIILSKKKLKISPKITGFDFNDLNYISVVDKEGQIFATYPNRVPSIIKYSTSQNSNSNIVKSDSVTSSQLENSPEIINLNDLGASASNAVDDINENKRSYAWLGLIGILFIGILSVVFIRSKRDYPDYVDKEISAKDMTIIE